MPLAGIETAGFVRDVEMAADKIQDGIALRVEIALVFENAGETNAEPRRFIAHPARRIEISSGADAEELKKIKLPAFLRNEGGTPFSQDDVLPNINIASHARVAHSDRANLSRQRLLRFVYPFNGKNPPAQPGKREQESRFEADSASTHFGQRFGLGPVNRSNGMVDVALGVTKTGVEKGLQPGFYFERFFRHLRGNIDQRRAGRETKIARVGLRPPVTGLWVLATCGARFDLMFLKFQPIPAFIK